MLGAETIGLDQIDCPVVVAQGTTDIVGLPLVVRRHIADAPTSPSNGGPHRATHQNRRP